MTQGLKVTEALKTRRRRSRPEPFPQDEGGQATDIVSNGAQSASGPLQDEGEPGSVTAGAIHDAVAEVPTSEEQGLIKAGDAASRPRPLYKDHVWDCAFESAKTPDGQPFEVLTIVDGYTQECLSIIAERTLSVESIIDRLFDLFVLREVPKQISLANVSTPVSKAVAEWLRRLPVETVVDEPGSRWQEAGTGSFAARLRDEVLSSKIFVTLADARALLGSWRRQYNETRPQHSPVEDEAQAPQDGEAVVCLEVEPPVGQTLPPDPVPAWLTKAAGKKAPVKKQRRDGWETRVPKWVVIATRIVEYVGIFLVVLLMTMVVLAMLAPHFGWRADTVLSGSMEPALPVGCVEVTRPVNAEDIKVGDIITFRSTTSGKLMSHRVVGVEETESYQFQTKGDANEEVDPYLVPAENVVGRVCFKVAHVGRVVEYLKTPIGFIILGLVGVALIVAEISSMLEVHWKESAQTDTEAKQG